MTAAPAPCHSSNTTRPDAAAKKRLASSPRNLTAHSPQSKVVIGGRWARARQLPPSTRFLHRLHLFLPSSVGGMTLPARWGARIVPPGLFLSPVARAIRARTAQNAEDGDGGVEGRSGGRKPGMLIRMS